MERIVPAALVALILAGCGGGPDSTPVASATAPATPGDTIAVGAGACGFAVAGGAVWVTTLQDNAVVPVDPATREPGEPVALPGSPCWLVGNDVSVWVAPSEDGVVVELDARAGEQRGRVEIGQAPTDPKLALADGSLWATVTPDGGVVRIDGQEVTARVRTGREPRSILVADGLIWVANGDRRSACCRASDPQRQDRGHDRPPRRLARAQLHN